MDIRPGKILLFANHPISFKRYFKSIKSNDLEPVEIQDFSGLKEESGGARMLLFQAGDSIQSTSMTLSRIREVLPEIPILVLSAEDNTRMAVEAMKGGANEFLFRPADETLRKTIAEYIHKPSGTEPQDPKTEGFSGMFGSSAAMKEVFRTIRTVATTDAIVLIRGETGTGKERAARALHAASRRSEEPFIVLDCAAIPDTLLESTLFGHEKGSFTGAAKTKPGMLELASGGTLMLDEIGDMPLHLQAKLLRAIQEQRFFHIGGVKEICVDVRLLAATNRDLEQSVREGLFREDLYYRLKVMTIELPPLRQRREDIEPLTRHFLRRFAEKHQRPVPPITAEALQFLAYYSWPGNVRQLENVMERAVVLAEGRPIAISDLPPELAAEAMNTARQTRHFPEPEVRPVSQEEDLPSLKNYRESQLQKIEGEYARRILRHTGGNVRAAARIAGISARSLYRLLDRCGIRVEEIGLLRQKR